MKTKNRKQLRLDRRARPFKRDIRVRKQIRKLNERQEHGTLMVVHDISGGLKALVHEQTNRPRVQPQPSSFTRSPKYKFRPRGVTYSEAVRDQRGDLKVLTFNKKLKER